VLRRVFSLIGFCTSLQTGARPIELIGVPEEIKFKPMIIYRVVNNLGCPMMDTKFSTRERAAQVLRDDDHGEEDGYFLQEHEVSEREYLEILSAEAREDDGQDDLPFGNAETK